MKPAILLVDNDYELIWRQRVRSWRKNEVLFREGDLADAVFVVVSGTVRTSMMLSDARRQVIGFHEAGDLFGFTSGEHYQYSAEAVSAADLYDIRRVDFERRVDAQPNLCRSLTLLSEHELKVAQQRMLMLGRMTARERLCSFLLERLNGGGLTHLPMSRLDIADYLGLSLETISRTFTSLRVDGVICTPTTNTIEVIDPARLRGPSAFA
jgi:CRP/FNR family transcriptional regulator, anaerobic regulatory protein